MNGTHLHFGVCRMLAALTATTMALTAGCTGAGRTAGDAPPAKSVQSGAELPTPPELRLDDTAHPTRYRIDLTLIPEEPEFSGLVEIDIDVMRPTDHLWLHGTRLTIKEAAIQVGNDHMPMTKLATSNKDFLGFALPREIGPGKATLRIRYTGEVSDSEYIGIFRQKEGDDWYLYTQFESLGARRAFPSFDEPRFKIPFKLTLRVPRDHIAAANTPAVSLEEGDSDLKTLHFAESKRLPSYLVAFAVGPFDVVDLGAGGRNQVPMRILTPKGKAAEASYAARVTGPILAALEDYFDMPYPYEKLDSVAVPHFLGAMENPGLVTYTSRLLLSKPGEDTPGSMRSYASVCAHELAHQWFGNLVTLAWWDDLWLNEAFATWLAAKTVENWKPEWDGAVSAASSRDRAMAGDSLMSSRQIRQPIVSNHDIHNAFDGITYGKGAAVISMFEHWIGEGRFREAVRAYMREHAWGNATATDFLTAMARVSQTGVPAAFESFIDQPGVPLVSMELTCEKGEAPTLELSQERFLPTGSAGDATAQSWQIPVCVKFGFNKRDGKNESRQCTLMTRKTQSMKLSTDRCPTWVSGNADAMGYYRVAYSRALLAELLAVAPRFSAPERVNIVGNLDALVDAAKVDLSQALAYTPALMRDSHYQVVRRAVGFASSIHPMLEENMRPAYRRYVKKVFGKRARRLGWHPQRGELDETRLLRPALMSLVAVRGEDPALGRQAVRLARAWLEKPAAVAPEMRGVVLSAAARFGDAALYEEFYGAAKAETDRRRRGHMLSAMASFRAPELIQRNLELSLSDEFEPSEVTGLLRGGLGHPETRQMVYDWIKENYDALVDHLPRRARRYLIYTATPFCDQEHLADMQAFYAGRIDEIEGGPRSLAQASEGMRLCIAYRDAQRPGVRAFLGRY